MNREKNVENTIELHLTRDRPMVSDSPKIKNNFNEKGPLPIDKNKDEKREKRKEHDRIAAKIRRQKNKEINKEKRTALDRTTSENEKLNGKIEKLKSVRNQLEFFWVHLKFDIVMENMLSETINTVGEEEAEITATSECKTLILVMFI